MSLPCVAIIGRPNVGKSSLFNCLARRRIAIVDPTAGVTRDRLNTMVACGDRWFELIDTGGVGVVDADELSDDVDRQITLAMEQAQVLIFLVDAREGVTGLDETVAHRIRSLGKPVLLVANKCDMPLLDRQSVEFFQLGFGEPLCVSAQHGRNKELLIQKLGEMLPEMGEQPEDPVLKLAIVGRRNTGKSTFINNLAGQERVIVSEVPGTTRDSVDVRFEKDGKTLLAIDTAGVRKRRSVKGNIEFYSLARAQRSIRRADVVFLFLEPRLRVSKVDKQLADTILEQSRPAVFVINKWDLVRDQIITSQMGDYIRQVFPSLEYVPIAFITALTGRNVPAVIDLARSLQKQSASRVSTSELNKVLREAMDASQPPNRLGRTPRLYYAAQIAESPPTIVLHTNASGIFDPPYLRYLERTVREKLGFQDVPLRLIVQGKGATRALSPDSQEEPASEPGEDIENGSIIVEPVAKMADNQTPTREKGPRIRRFVDNQPEAEQPGRSSGTHKAKGIGGNITPEKPERSPKRPARSDPQKGSKFPGGETRRKGSRKPGPHKGKEGPSTWDL